jgi:hypothetical protein
MKKIMQSLVLTIYSMVFPLAVYADKAGREHGDGFTSDVIVTLGAMTITCLIATFLMGYFMPKNRKLLFLWHKRLAIATVVLAASHALIILIFT